MYRSFVTCDDPKGVVECAKIRKYRTCSKAKKKDQMKIKRTTENSETHLINKRYKEEKVQKESREDQSLNKMIGSWSSDLSCDASEDIAKELLIGAFDLQDSLVMLSKLQEASQGMAPRLKKKQTEIPKRARHCKEELQKVIIKDSWVGQNIFPRTAIEGLDSAAKTPSTISSHSNLVAKLMGLEEEAPSRSFMDQKGPIIERDMPKIRKNNSIVEKVTPNKQKILKENLESIHFKRLLKNSDVKEPRLKVHQLNDLSQIVHMNPQCGSYQEPVKTHMPEEIPLRKMKGDEVVSSKSRTIRLHRKSSRSSSMGKKLDIMDHVSKRLEPYFLKEVVKLNAKGIHPIENVKSSCKVKLYCHPCQETQVNKTLTDGKRKVETISRKLVAEKDISECEIVARIRDQWEITSTKLMKPEESGSTKDRNEISCLKRTASDSISISKTETQNINNSMEITESDSVVDSLTQRDNFMKNQSPIAEPEATDPPIAEQIRPVGSANKICEECKWSKNPSENEARKSTNCRKNDSNKPENEEFDLDLKRFLLTSQSFIGHAKKLFNLDVELDCPNPNKALLRKDEPNVRIANYLRLYLDCAKELTERRSRLLLQEAQQVVRSFLLTNAGNSRLYISLGRLVEEIYNGIEDLKFYNGNSSGEKLFVDNLFPMTENDMMRCNGLDNGIWEEWRWRHGFSVHEYELVVIQVESLLESELIEEVIINL